MAGLTQFGFQRKSFNEIKTSIQNRLNSSLGQQFNFSSDGVLSKLVDNVSLEVDEAWQVFEGVINARTINGAEGVYLDELLSSLGVFREGASAASDTVMVGINETAPVTEEVLQTAVFSSPVGDFFPVEDTFIGNINTSAIFVPNTPNVGGENNITISLTGREGNSVDFVISSSNTDTEVKWDSYLQSLVNVCRDSLGLTPSERNSCFYVQGEGAYIGFTDSKEVSRVGVNLTFNISANSSVALNTIKYTRYSPVSVIADEAGFKKFTFGDISGMSPQPVGFESARNVGVTYNGSESETDTAYRLRSSRVKLQANNSTRLSLEAALLGLEGISQVRVYENPFNTDRHEALANTFNTVVLGGDALTITDTIFNKKPINTLTSGSEFSDKSLAGGLSERVYYTPAKQKQFSVRIEYKTRDSIPINSSLQNQIITSFEDITNIADLGDKVENDSLKGIVYGIVGFTKLDRVVVKVKGEFETLFTVQDIIMNFDEYLVLPSSNITIVQVY